MTACCASPGLGVDGGGDCGRLEEESLQLLELLTPSPDMLSDAFERSLVSARFSFLPAWICDSRRTRSERYEMKERGEGRGAKARGERTEAI